MILVTVGMQDPFDRLLQVVDEWTGRNGRRDVLAQIGRTDWRPKHMQFVTSFTPIEFRAQAEAARVIVSHAGMGTILTALELGKPILVMPKRGDLRETRNDHQIATAEKFRERGDVAVAFDDEELSRKLDELGSLKPGRKISSRASPQLLQVLRDFVEGGGAGAASPRERQGSAAARNP